MKHITHNIKHKESVLLFTLEYPPFKGGVANYYGNIVKYFNSEIKVLTGKKLLRPHWIFSFLHLWRAIKKNKIDTVLVGHILPLGTTAWLLHKVCKFEYIVFLHGMDLAFALRSPRKKWLARKILADAQKVICVNSRVAEDARKIVDSEKVVVVNPGVTIKKQENKKIKKQLIEKYNLENKKILLQVGRLVGRKGIDKTLEAMKTLKDELPGLIYVIIGNGEEKKNYELRITNYELDDHVLLITEADDEELQAWYELCDIFIMPSRDIAGDFEGFGIVYLEANAHGKTVIAGDSGGVRDAVEHNVNGLLVNPESVDEIKNAIIKLYNDENLRKKLGEQGRERAGREFQWSRQIEKIKQI